MNITIAEELKALCPDVCLGVLSYEAEVSKSSPELLSKMDSVIKELENSYTREGITGNLHIAATRTAYKAFGKSPSEYRNAAEAMLRRIVKGSGLYHINNIVDINNIVSTSSGYSIGSYDAEDLKGDITLCHADEGTHYEGIGKSSINIGKLPVLYDEEGPFGNPSSDSQRAMIKEGKHRIVSIIYSFDKSEDLNKWMEEFKKLLNEYCNVSDVDSYVI